MTRIQAWCLGFFAALTFYWGAATFGAGFDWMRQYRLVRKAIQTQAVVTSRELQNHNLAHYEFEANGKRYTGAGQGDGEVGQTVTVFYLPDDPSFSTLKHPGEDLGFMIIAPLLLSTIAGFLFQARAGARRERSSR
jgi:hypothetical protein